MSERYTSGRVGRFDFKTANRLVDAADRIDGGQLTHASFPSASDRRTIVARLTATYQNLYFESENEERTLVAWDWEEMAVVESASPLIRRSLAYRNGITSSQYDNQTRGLAVCIDGEAKAGDIVVLHAVVNEQNYDPHVAEKWWAFKGSKRVNTSVCLRILSSQSIATRRWKYNVEPVSYGPTGVLIPATFYPSGVAYNTYESEPYGHGQATSFSQPSGTLQVNACQGIVVGTLLTLTTAEPVYAFEATNPMAPTCSGV